MHIFAFKNVSLMPNTALCKCIHEVTGHTHMCEFLNVLEESNI